MGKSFGIRWNQTGKNSLKLEKNTNPSDIPNKILKEWRKIGQKGETTEKNGTKYLMKKIKFNRILKNKFTATLKKEKENAIKEQKI